MPNDHADAKESVFCVECGSEMNRSWKYCPECGTQVKATSMARISVNKVAAAMGASPQFVRRGLQQRLFPWGYAIKMSGRYAYWISAEKFTECTGKVIS